MLKVGFFSILATVFLLQTSCSSGGGGTTVVTTPTEAAYCSTTTSYSGGVTVTGTATYNRRQVTTGPCQLGASVSGGPIRFAEVNVLSNGQIIQCGETDANGQFSVVVPANINAEIRINSRGDNNHVKVSVLDSPNVNGYYSLSHTFSTVGASGTYAIGGLNAPVTGDILGGAFAIYDNIVKANQVLRYLVCGTSVNTTCAGFSVAPKATVYWAPGVNPGTYFGSSSAVSFYEVGASKLYILGGINGNTTTQDTDHFDEAVVVHEYAHFLDDQLSKSDSRGGFHNGNFVLDARLVWGEGWANFLSSVIRNNTKYTDTFGNTSGSTGCFFDYDLDLNGGVPGALDIAVGTGEGVFREMAIARALWDAVDPIENLPAAGTVGADGGGTDDNATDAVNQAGNSSFTKFWNLMVGTWKTTTANFRNAGRFFELLADATINASSVLTFQKILNDTTHYAKPLPTAAGACNITIDAIAANNCPSAPVLCTAGQRHYCCSNQYYNNDFYDVNWDGSFTTIAITRVSGTANLDLYLYKQGYDFGSDNTDAVRTSTTAGGDESINLSGLSHGRYLLNVSVATAGGNPASTDYQIRVNGTQVCP